MQQQFNTKTKATLTEMETDTISQWKTMTLENYAQN